MKSEQENKSTAVQKTDVADWTICESTAHTNAQKSQK
jgi:hypothetical protein